ncbi:DUF2752 domain-containing protein [Lactonifactor sp. BIOML-A3]|uniref:DUF2752 domain-containing protein n=1 Tax=unclassified Lactonifactor TaxID=2636670 RepID=UPI0012B11219|nr:MULTISPECIES: DUF2752 domain-containing protein [unclassified Lactonifactor]MSA03153.1 DUF2752 domain-containing protein [Lactonifactor sp. BIOML-A5]MSA09386.1 DUF2752 domain-containing protein [Lactonifactor sp. BIOML-A4]MSA14024.1 DUF2752 domain-containing protein [Lactonifactor sp. BIOML-A3]MSA17269.1 DUF2752 domain-containing protein [Lactonifactor sp. BIOML-A2]MSA37166.1 DUF2752 domain-containing protein [Lactonifactor sp. BIOML-A1]
MKRIISKRENRSLYWTGWALLAACTGIVLAARWLHISYSDYSLPCIFHRYTGYYCPGCGGTRAAIALSHGRLVQALWYHPLVPYAAVLYVWFMVSNTIEILSGNRWKIGMRFREGYLYTALGILAVNWIFKNILLAVWGIQL